MFEDYRAQDVTYFGDTGIFPIMHTVVLRADVVKANPGIAQSLYQAFTDAKAIGMRALHSGAEAGVSLAWLADVVAEHHQVLGDDLWPYGMAANRSALEALVEECRFERLIGDDVTVDELFLACE
jgi:4,5-dihydroxyphthalate decarboxylase